MLHPGLYEQVINSTLNSELSTIPEARKAIGFDSCWVFCLDWMMWILESCRPLSRGCCKCFT